jgi:hypothetical protein
LQLGNFAHIRLYAEGPIAEGGDLLLQSSGGIEMSDIVNDDVRALFGQLQHDRQANPAVTSGDDCDFIFRTHDIYSSILDCAW